MGSYGEPAAAAAAAVLVDPAVKPHVVLITMPAPGHILPTVALGKALARRGLKVTFLSSGVVSETLRREVDETVEEEEDMDMTVGSVVEDPVPEPESPVELLSWLFRLPPEEMVKRAVELLRSLSPPPSLLLSDVFIPWTAAIAQELHIPRHIVVTMSATCLSFMFSVPQFKKEGLLPMKAATPVEFSVPGVGSVPQGDMWEYFIEGHPAQSDSMITCLEMLANCCDSSTYLINSVEALEPEVFRALQEPLPFTGQVAKVVSIGPLETSFATKENRSTDEIASLEVVKSKKNEMASEIVQWLDAQPAGSVVYVAFGSIFSLNAQQITELAHGLEASGQRFLWIIRPPEAPQVIVSQQGAKVQEQITALLPPGFEERTQGRGMLYTSWAPQPSILAHKAVGCFVTHCGWNSILEAISTCTPMLACPCFVDQWQNATFIETKLGIARLMKSHGEEYERDRITTMVKGIMLEGDIERRNIVRCNQILREAVTVSPSGSSTSNFQQYVDDIFTMVRDNPTSNGHTCHEGVKTKQSGNSLFHII